MEWDSSETFRFLRLRYHGLFRKLQLAVLDQHHGGDGCNRLRHRIKPKDRIYENGEAVTYQIVGDDEADIKKGKISVSSPIARAIIGKYAGDRVEVQTPGGVRKYEVLEVRYE